MNSISYLLNSHFFPSFSLENEGVGRPISTVSGLTTSSTSALIAQSFDSEDPDSPSVLVITPDTKSAEILFQDLKQWMGEDWVFLFPSLSLQPYEWRNPFGKIVEQRLECLFHFMDAGRGILITTLPTFLQKLPQPNIIKREVITLSKGLEISLDDLRESLTHLGFTEETMVEDIGQFSVRGGILDIYPFLAVNPVRLELWGDEIETIREFDIFSQRSIKEKKEVEILPINEVCFSPSELEEGLMNLDGEFESSQIEEEITRHLEMRDRKGMYWQQPFFNENHFTLLNYMVGNPLIYLDQKDKFSQVDLKLKEAFQKHYQDASEKGYVVAHPEKIIFSLEGLDQTLKNYRTLNISSMAIDGPGYLNLDIEQQTPGEGNLNSIHDVLENYKAKEYQIYLLSPNEGQGERLKKLCEDFPVDDVLIGQISKGFIHHTDRIAIFTDHQIFNRFSRQYAGKKNRSGGVAIPDFDALSRSDYVVHQDYGIGQYLGIKRIKIEEYSVDCILLQYKDGSKLTIPVSDLKKLQKYSGKDGASPTLSKLGGKTWEQLKTRTKKSIISLAHDLIELYAKRSAIKGFAFSKGSKIQDEFEEAFNYEPTPDQFEAIKSVKDDMEKDEPMDRLICGDVGFGKTEVAMRGAFKAVLDKKQVAILAPTTVLVAQHHASFQDRFGNWPVNIEFLNRFKSTQEEKKILADLKEGKIDIVIGTHRIISKDVEFKDIGLIIVDEEQKFGVKQKEQLKKARAEVDVISMSATPIPRSLHMSMVGARNFSLIQTPPRNRIPIETRVIDFDKKIIGEYLKSELERGGQSFFVHNRVQDIMEVTLEVEKMIPEARVGLAHGQMKEKDLEQIMFAFINREYDILVCTTIIESGIDIPNVNTIIIHNAHYFGLSQLFQLRGRVGRSASQAYCLLVAPPEEKFTDEAKKRLYALEKFTELGSGYKLAMRDLEIRGAGNILGVEQSGHISAVGFDTYCSLLKDAVRELQGKKEIPALESKVEYPKDAYLPESYIEDGLQRISLYQKISRSNSIEELGEIQEELKDRFGPLVPQVRTLLDVVQSQLLAQIIGFQKVSLTKRQLRLEFSEMLTPDPINLAKLLGSLKMEYKCLNQTPLVVVVQLNGKTTEQQIQQSVSQLILMSETIEDFEYDSVQTLATVSEKSS